jgi:hypothetical protein
VALSRLLAALLLAVVAADERTPVAGFFDLPVTGGTNTYDMLGLRPEERGIAVALLARSMFNLGSGAAERAASVRKHIAALSVPGSELSAPAESQPITIAAPLTADHWRDLLELPRNADLFAALLSNRSVLLACAGTLAADASMRALLERDRGLLRWIVRTAPSAYWLTARSLAVERDRVLVPGGPNAESTWESLTGQKVTKPTDFLRALLSRDHGRLAWFYDTVATMSPQRQSIALANARDLYAAFREADSNWRIEDHPFLRGVTDPWIVTTHIALDAGGVAPPNALWFWQALFDRGSLSRRDAESLNRAPDARASLSWLAQQVTGVGSKERRDRFEMVRFAQGVFPVVADQDYPEVLVALGGYRRYRSLLLTLDRMDIASPRVYARAVEAAARVDDLSGRDERHAVIAYQSALAILERARITGALDVAAAERIVFDLADTVARAERPFTATIKWMTSTLTAALPPLARPDQWTATTAYESQFLQALAGPPGTQGSPVSWEGLEYRVDFASAEHARVKRIREQLTSPGLDAAIESGDAQRIADALLVLIYTPALGDPEGPALLGGDIPFRHAFGLDGAAGLRRAQMAWALPREQVGDGSPWHLEGALIGLDIALARLALRRIADNEMPIAPTINLNDQLTLARTVVAMNPREFRDDDRDQLVAAITRGRARVAAAGTDRAALLALAAEVQMSAAFRQTLTWTLTRTPDAAPTFFGLRDLMWLGKPDVPKDRLDRWGVYAEGLNNRLRPAMPMPAPWESYSGRADGGLIATQTPDLTLRMAEETARLKLPAQLIPALLTFATQDYWHEVESRFPDDWTAMVRQPLAISPSRVEDYVAALAGDGPLRPR